MIECITKIDTIIIEIIDSDLNMKYGSKSNLIIMSSKTWENPCKILNTSSYCWKNIIQRVRHSKENIKV